MSFEPDQFRQLITATLKEFSIQCAMPSLFSEDAVELLMLTAAQETLLGKYIKQVRGPALGVFQMEPGAYRDLYNKYIVTKPTICKVFNQYFADGASWKANMMGNIPYQIVLSRLYYYRYPEALPNCSDLKAMATYYKKYWNTYLGKATVQEAIDRYNRYA